MKYTNFVPPQVPQKADPNAAKENFNFGREKREDKEEDSEKGKEKEASCKGDGDCKEEK